MKHHLDGGQTYVAFLERLGRCRPTQSEMAAAHMTEIRKTWWAARRAGVLLPPQENVIVFRGGIHPKP